MFIYDVSKDSDGGAWTEKCQHTSWYNETIYGKWLGAQASEANARNINANVGSELVDTANEASTWSVYGSNTVEQDGDAVKGTYVNNTSGVFCYLNSQYGLSQNIDTTKLYKLSFEIKVNTGSVTASWNNGVAQNVITRVINATESYQVVEMYVTPANTIPYLRVQDMGAGEIVWVRNISVKEVISQTTATGDYYQLTTDGKFYALNAGSGVTEVFRGNKRSFPKLAAIVAESASLTIYDLTEPGRPMWMRFVSGSTTERTLISAATCLHMLNGILFCGNSTLTNQQASSALDIVKETGVLRVSGAGYRWVGTIAERNATRYKGDSTALPIIYFGSNAVAMTVLPDAPLDPATGLKVPTIAVATAGGISIIQNTGVVRNSSSTSAFTQVTLTPQLLSAGRADAVWYYAANPNSLGASFALTTKNASTATDFNVGNTTLLKAKDRANYARTSGAVVQLLRNNEGVIGKGIAAKLSDTYNTGWLAGDIRRAYLANSKTADRSYKGATATETGTVTTAAVNTGNDLVAYSGFSAANYLREPYSADLDFGTDEWSCSAWVNVPATLPVDSFQAAGPELVTNGDFSSGTTGWTFAAVSLVDGRAVFGASANIQQNGLTFVAGVVYRIEFDVTAYTAGAIIVSLVLGGASVNVIITSVTTQRYAVLLASTGNTRLQFSSNSAGNFTIDNISAKEASPALLADRAYSTGPKINLGVTGTGRLTATAYDGTTTRTVTTTDAYNTATWLKVRANYTTDGRLAILVNGVEVAAATGTPLLTLSSRYNLLNYSEQFDNAAWTKQNGAISANVETAPDGTLTADKFTPTAAASTDHRIITGVIATTSGYALSIYVKPAGYSKFGFRNGAIGEYATFILSGTGTVIEQSSCTATITEESDGWYLVRIFDTSTSIRCDFWPLADGYTSGNPGEYSYTGDGTSGIYIWGAQLVEGSVAKDYQRTTTVAETEVPPLTIGNSYALDAPFPGSIALLKLSASVPTAEQAVFMYEQEKHLFAAGAKCVLPASTSVLDLAYDDKTDTWITTQASQESTWSGLVRTANTAPPAGSFSRSTATSGIELSAITTTNPGVYVSSVNTNITAEINEINTINKQIVKYTYTTIGFTATTVSGNNQITSVSVTTGTPYVGMKITGTGIPANTVITGIYGTVYYISNNATANNTNVAIGQTDFVLPIGYTSVAVYHSGKLKREGSTKDYTRSYDGFRETINFGVSPGNAALVTIQAIKQ